MTADFLEYFLSYDSNPTIGILYFLCEDSRPSNTW
jgi:hypothetical protein